MIAALVPVKTLATSKSRLLPDLPREAVARLATAMLRDVVAALRRVPALSRVAVVTPDAVLAQTAREAGAEALLRDDPGLNPAVERAAAELAPQRGDGVLVVLGDLPTLTPADLSRLLEAIEVPGAALAPSSDGGTSALLRVPRDAIPARFGPDSAARHRAEALRAGVRFREISLASLAVDVDVSADVECILRSPTLGSETRAALEGMGLCAA
ncbi:MAG: 2-phospho-L-lactate guanylyltransferase [Myxococcales bacterium]|nr:2-phospho-L-lactate guanylyltransferase [Myxococcales bacterium]